MFYSVLSGGGSSSNSSNPPRNRTFNCRFLIKPPDDSNQTFEEKQQRVSKYENMQVSIHISYNISCTSTYYVDVHEFST